MKKLYIGCVLLASAYFLWGQFTQPPRGSGSGGGGSATNALTHINGNTNLQHWDIVSNSGSVFNIAASEGGNKSTNTFNLPTAAVDKSGALSSNDWQTFIAKQASNVVLASLSGLTDPNANRIVVWDDTDNAFRNAVIGTGLSYDQATDTLSASGGAADNGGAATNTAAVLTGGTLINYTNAGLTTVSGAVAYVWQTISASDIDWLAGNSRYKSLTANTTFTFSNTNNDLDVVVKLQQDSTGTRSVTWPGGITWVNSTNQSVAVGVNTNANFVSVYHFWKRSGTVFADGPSTAPSMFAVDFDDGGAGVTSARFLARITDETGSGSVVGSTSPTLLTPIMDDYVEINEEAAPGTPASGKGRLYAKVDGKLYWKDDAGTEVDLTLGASGGEANTLASLGTGWSLPTTKSGVVLQINSITNDASLSSSSNANTITFSRAALTGDVTASAGANATTIANDAVSNAKLANMTQYTIKGRVTSGTGDPEDLSADSAVDILDTASPTRSTGNGPALVWSDAPVLTTMQDSMVLPMGAWFTNNLLGAHPSGASAGAFTNVADGWTFADAVTNGIRTLIALPGWDAGVIRVEAEVVCGGTNHTSATNVVFLCRAAALKVGEDWSSPTFGTGIAVTNHINIAANIAGKCITRNITVGNTPASTNAVLLEWQRLGADAGDTLTNSPLRTVNLKVHYKRTLNADWPAPSL